MNKFLSNTLLAVALSLVATNVYAFTLIGGTLIEDNQVKAITVGSTTANEAYGVYVVAAVPGDLSDNNCLATYPTFAVAGC